MKPVSRNTAVPPKNRGRRYFSICGSLCGFCRAKKGAYPPKYGGNALRI